MKTIIEVINGYCYVYTNTEKHFKKIEKAFSGKRISCKELENNCSMPDNCHIVIDGVPK